MNLARPFFTLRCKKLGCDFFCSNQGYCLDNLDLNLSFLTNSVYYMKKMENIPIKSEVALCRSDGFTRGYLPFFQNFTLEFVSFWLCVA